MAQETKNTTIWTLSKINPYADAKHKANELVMAWGIDRHTGHPRYILELDRNHRGAKCDCLCASCNLPLTAVNAAKLEYQQRPHFKHPKGAQRDSCLVLTARYAIAQQLLDLGFVELPQRRMSARIVGLSGKEYEAWRYIPPERVKIIDTQFSDKAKAMLTLDDGRKILVMLTGSLSDEVDAEGSPIPVISIDADSDLSVAGMSPSELRSRLALLWAGACWHSHWADAELAGNAEHAATQQAIHEYDWLVDDGSIENIDQLTNEQKRETLLHLEVKRILEQEKRINLPELIATAERHEPVLRGYSRETRWPSEIVSLQDVRLEKHLGSIIPDVMASVGNPDSGDQVYTLLIEVTVTNTITQERRQRIESTNLPALEIDLSQMGGLITRTELVDLVVNELIGKRWLHHPKAVAESNRLNDEIEEETRDYLERKRLRDSALDTTPEVWATRLLTAISTHSKLSIARDSEKPPSMEEKQAKELIEDAIYALVLHGYREALDLQDAPSILLRIVYRILSIKKDIGVGYKSDTGWRVINTMFLDREFAKAWHTLYLIAINQYKPLLNDKQHDMVKDWRTKVIASIKVGETLYLRNTKYDRFLRLLFPELKEAIENGFGTKPPIPQTISQNTSTSSSAFNSKGYKSVRDNDVWLRGAALEQWKRMYPEAAESFFGSQDDD